MSGEMISCVSNQGPDSATGITLIDLESNFTHLEIQRTAFLCFILPSDRFLYLRGAKAIPTTAQQRNNGQTTDLHACLHLHGRRARLALH